MKYTCPKCNKSIEVSTEALIASGYKIVCPQCLTGLQIIGDYAYVPLDDGSLNLSPHVEPEPAETPAAETPAPVANTISTTAPSAHTPTQPSTPPEIPTLPNIEPREKPQPDDPLLNDVINYLKTCSAITPSMLTKAFNIEFSRAAAIIEQLEQRGIVGPYRGGAPRKILIPHNDGLPNAYDYGKPYNPQTDTTPDNSTGKKSQESCVGCFWWLMTIMLLSYIIRSCMAG